MNTSKTSTLDDSQDAIYDYGCMPCAKRQLNAEALSYCKKCCKLFCDVCARYHDAFTSGHELLGKDDVMKWGVVKQDTTTYECDQHPGKELEIFCVYHDRLACSICIGLNHRTCQQVKHISDVATGIQQTEEFKQLATNTDRPQHLLTELLHKRKENLKKLQEISEEIKTSFKTMREKIEKLEKNSLAELEKLQCTLEENIHTDIDTATCLLNKIKDFLADINQIGNNNETFAFQAFKSCQKALSETKQLLASIYSEDYKLIFTPNPTSAKLLSSLHTLGELDIIPNNLLSKADHIYTISSKHLHNIKTPDDDNTCSITGLCELPDGLIAIVDGSNKKVKLFNLITNSVIAALTLSCPRGICHTNGTEMAVTTYTEQKGEIKIINAGSGKLIDTNTIKLQGIKLCDKIIYHDSRLYVGSVAALHVYTLSGVLIKILYSNKDEMLVFPFSMNENNDRNIYVGDYLGNMYTTDGDGEKLSMLKRSLIDSPGMCQGEDGTIFVSSRSTNTIKQIDCHGKRLLSTLAEAKDGLKMPVCLWYNRSSRQLLVGQILSNQVLILKLR